MKRTGLILSIVFVLIAASAKAQDYKMGLGIRLSSNPAIVNNSISFKYFFTDKTAAEALFSLEKPFAFGLLVEQHQPFMGNGFKYFYGGGAYAAFSGEKTVGLQGVLGLDYKLPSIPFNLSVDWKPELTLANQVSFEPAALGLSARFTFK